MTATRMPGLALACAVVMASSVAPLPGGHWPQWRGPARDGVSIETGLLQRWPAAGPPKVWSATGVGIGYSSVAVTGGRIFTIGDSRAGQQVIALDEETGKVIWRTRIGNAYNSPDDFSGPRGTPTVDGDRIYAIGTDGQLVCLDAATGKERWRRSLARDFGGFMMSGWEWSESPLVDEHRVVVTPGGPKAGIVALDKMTGADIWRSVIPRIGSLGNDGAGYSSIVISQGGGVKHYVQLLGRGLVGVRASDGRFLWGNNAVANDIANISTPIVRGNYVFASTGYDTGAVMVELSPAPEDRVTATQRYFISSGRFQNHHGGMVLIGDYIYGGHGQSNGFPVCIELATGRLMWPQTRSSVGSGSAAVTAADGRLYFRYQNGQVVLIEASPTAYREAGSFEIPNPDRLSWPHPVVAGGRLYLREQDVLHAYNVKR